MLQATLGFVHRLEHFHQPTLTHTKNKLFSFSTTIKHHPNGMELVSNEASTWDLSPGRPLKSLVQGRLSNKTQRIRDSVDVFLNLIPAGIVVVPVYGLLYTTLFWNGFHCHMARSFGVLAACLSTSILTFTSLSFVTRIVAWNAMKRQNNADRRMKIVQEAASGINVSVIVSVLITAFVTFCGTPHALHFHPVQFGYRSFAVTSLSFTLISDILFYTIHRCMHQPHSSNRLLRWLTFIHKEHHGVGGNKSDLIPHQGARAHVVEFLLNNLTVVAPPLLLGAHPSMHFTYHMVAALAAWFFHCSFCTVDQGAHARHHATSGGNYGVAGVMDVMFGTIC
jgi:sterol desaturase/sphingolipid hydroxylase (fatty acid hydroxylase superfamily)